MNNLTAKELIRYVENGTIEQINSEDFLKVVFDFEEEISQLEEELHSHQKDYEEGYQAAIEEAINALNSL